MKIKYATLFWSAIILLVLCISGLFYATGAFASETKVTVHCKARNITIINNGSDYLFANVDFERGNFRELPDDKATSVVFYNIDTRKVLIIGDRASGGSYMSIYKSVDDVQAKKPEYQDNCFLPMVPNGQVRAN